MRLTAHRTPVRGPLRHFSRITRIYPVDPDSEIHAWGASQRKTPGSPAAVVQAHAHDSIEGEDFLQNSTTTLPLLPLA
ncbi:MAG TPA: hypothetical protein VMF56_09280, partial [Acidobacteriaceae bacterium]|nr:hypothetical protein [Acidobacteriaceae bacterium]